MQHEVLPDKTKTEKQAGKNTLKQNDTSDICSIYTCTTARQKTCRQSTRTNKVDAHSWGKRIEEQVPGESSEGDGYQLAP